MKVKMGIIIDSELKRELEEHNFENRRTDYKINYSEVCGTALRLELDRMRQAPHIKALREYTKSQDSSQDSSQDDKSLLEIREDPKDKALPEVREEDQDSQAPSFQAPIKEKPCQVCGNMFSYKSASALYCSNKCKQKNKNAKQKKE